jgi:hypothetical protein
MEALQRSVSAFSARKTSPQKIFFTEPPTSPSARSFPSLKTALLYHGARCHMACSAGRPTFSSHTSLDDRTTPT